MEDVQQPRYLVAFSLKKTVKVLDLSIKTVKQPPEGHFLSFPLASALWIICRNYGKWGKSQNKRFEMTGKEYPLSDAVLFICNGFLFG